MRKVERSKDLGSQAQGFQCGLAAQCNEDRDVARGFGCMEVIDHLESRSFMEWGAEARLGWVEEYVGGDTFETVSIEHAFGKAECEVN